MSVYRYFAMAIVAVHSIQEELSDQVWYMWDADVIDDELAAIAWFWLRERPLCTQKRTLRLALNMRPLGPRYNYLADV